MFSALLLSPDNEFVEASPALYSPEEFGKSTPFAFSCRNPAWESRIWWAPGSKAEGRREGAGRGTLALLHVPLTVRTGFFLERIRFGGGGGGESLGCVCVCVSRSLVMLPGARHSKLLICGPLQAGRLILPGRMQLAGKCHKDIVWLLPNLNLMKSRAKNVLVITFQDLGAAIVLDFCFSSRCLGIGHFLLFCLSF